MYLLIDDHRDVLPAEQKGNVGRGGFSSLGAVNEILLTTVSSELFESLATGKSVELRAGSYETKLKDEHQQAFRDLLSLARGEQKKP